MRVFYLFWLENRNLIKTAVQIWEICKFPNYSLVCILKTSHWEKISWYLRNISSLYDYYYVINIITYYKLLILLFLFCMKHHVLCIFKFWIFCIFIKHNLWSFLTCMYAMPSNCFVSPSPHTFLPRQPFYLSINLSPTFCLFCDPLTLTSDIHISLGWSLALGHRRLTSGPTMESPDSSSSIHPHPTVPRDLPAHHVHRMKAGLVLSKPSSPAAMSPWLHSPCHVQKIAEKEVERPTYEPDDRRTRVKCCLRCRHCTFEICSKELSVLNAIKVITEEKKNAQKKSHKCLEEGKSQLFSSADVRDAHSCRCLRISAHCAANGAANVLYTAVLQLFLLIPQCRRHWLLDYSRMLKEAYTHTF